MSKTFYAWVTLLTEAYVDGITSKLVRRSYGVSPLASSGELFIKNGGAVLLSLRIGVEDEKVEKLELDASKFSDELKTILGELKAVYHSIIIYENNAEFAWLPGSKPPGPPNPKETTRFDRVQEDEPKTPET